MELRLSVTHIIKEAVSPPDAPIWHMHCGLAMIALANGHTIPPEDFYHEAFGDKATCRKCRMVRGLVVPAVNHVAYNLGR